MSYGVTFTNDSGVVTLDSEFARLVVLHQGTWSGNGSGITVNFPKAVTTAEPPLVFVRPNQSNTLCFCVLRGSAGNWTGFSFVGISGVATSGKWFAAAFKAEATAKYGLRIWDPAGVMLFDSGTPAAQFTRVITSWSYLGATTNSQGQSVLRWTASSSLSGGDYMLLNNIAMDIAGSVSTQGNLYAVWEYNNNRLVIQVVGVEMQTSLYIPVVFAKPIS